MVQSEELAQLENVSSGIDISKQNKEEVVAFLLTTLFMCVLLFCIVHRVPRYPCNTAADVSFSLWSSAAVQNHEASFLFAVIPS